MLLTGEETVWRKVMWHALPECGHSAWKAEETVSATKLQLGITEIGRLVQSLRIPWAQDFLFGIMGTGMEMLTMTNPEAIKEFFSKRVYCLWRWQPCHIVFSNPPAQKDLIVDYAWLFILCSPPLGIPRMFILRASSSLWDPHVHCSF